ncbi:MAG: PBP1A family penicillin-binding protein [Caldilineaceae bacterium]
MLFLTACSADTAVPQVGPRPASELSAAVEAYLQTYQPGPLPRLFQTTYVYDRNGELMAELFSEGRRSWVSLDRISPYLLEATIATEDSTFFINQGIDPLRIAGAAVQNVESGDIVSGASTITMQLARNLFLGADDRYDQSFDRKILEAGLARELTETYTKQEILEMYLNTINYGNLAYGPEAAAQVYFGKSAADLTQAEATLLAGIPQWPAVYNPFRNFEGVRNRQNTVLSLMVRHGYMTQEEADDIFADPIFLNPAPGAVTVQAPHFVNYLITQLDNRFGDGYTRRAGLHIYSTLDLQIQAVAQEIVTRQVARLQPTYDMNNGALVAMKSGTAEILAMVGSVDYTNDAIDGQVNVATRRRQPGSSIKPILFATALNDNLISPASVIWDAPVRYKITGQPDYEPKNYDARFHGPVTARVALANSYNIPAVKLLDQVGVERMLENARDMGIGSLDRGPEWYGLSLTLGGGEVTLLDLSTAYHTIANGGAYLAPRPILAMSDAAGRSMAEELGLRAADQVLSRAAAFLLTDMMSDNNARIPMFGANNRLVLSRPVAAKTGTTDDNRDNWTMGFTRYLVTGVWVGNTQGRPMRNNATGVGTAAVIWNEFMTTMIEDPDLSARLGAPSDPAQWTFNPPEDVTLRPECPASLVCRNGGGEFFANDWLEVAEFSGGPLTDSVIRAPSLAVFRDGQRIGYCLEDRGVVRTLVRLPGRFGLPSSVVITTPEDEEAGDKQASIAADIALDSPNLLTNLEIPEIIDLAVNSLNWQRKTGRATPRHGVQRAWRPD